MDQESPKLAPVSDRPVADPTRSGLPYVVLQGLGMTPEQLTIERPPRAGDLCPQCQSERLDYDGLLNLACPGCGYTFGGGAGCT